MRLKYFLPGCAPLQRGENLPIGLLASRTVPEPGGLACHHSLRSVMARLFPLSMP